MFLVVFVSLVISIIGLYAQVLSVQTAKMYAAQKGLAQTMLVWHASAVNMVRQNVPTAPGAIGCNLTGPAAAGNGPQTCAEANGNEVTLLNGGVPSTLPPGYNAAYSFNSLMYQDPATGSNYVVTYATNAGDGYIHTFAGNSSGYTLSDLSAQFGRIAHSYLLYGSVVGPAAAPTLDVITPISGTTTIVNGVATTLNYAICPPNAGTICSYLTVPLPAAVPTGAFAVVSSAS